jgi:hypothetical protein
LVQRFVAVAECDLTAAAAGSLRDVAEPVRAALESLVRGTKLVMARAAKNPDEIGAAAADYLRLFGLVATGWMWVRMASVAQAKSGETSTKVETARFFVGKLLPQAHALAAQIETGAAPVMSIAAAEL